MPTTMALWQLESNGTAMPVPADRLAAEATIESAVESAPELLGMDVLIIGRQVPTPSGPLDLLAIDSDARLVVIENKRDRTPREVLAQVIDYASYVVTLKTDEIVRLYESYRSRNGESDTDLLQTFEDHFGIPLETIGEVPRMLIVASRLDESTERMIGFLSERFDVPVNAALFQPFTGGLIGRTWLRAETTEPARSRSTANQQAREESKVFWDAWLVDGVPRSATCISHRMGRAVFGSVGALSLASQHPSLSG